MFSKCFFLLSRYELVLLEHFLLFFNGFIVFTITNFGSHYHDDYDVFIITVVIISLVSLIAIAIIISSFSMLSTFFV